MNDSCIISGLFDASEPALLSEVTWPGGICPTLPADPASEGWVLAMYPNDDESSSEQSIGFNFNLFGAIFNALYINNNGNLSFGNPFYDYTSTGRIHNTTTRVLKICYTLITLFNPFSTILC